MIDTLVIGGEVSGLTVVHELMLRGRDVVLLERPVHPDEFGPQCFNGQSRASDQVFIKVQGCY